MKKLIFILILFISFKGFSQSLYVPNNPDSIKVPVNVNGAIRTVYVVDLVKNAKFDTTALHQQLVDHLAAIQANASAITLKQNQLNGTGFVKANGTTISYDNTNYISDTSRLHSQIVAVNNALGTKLNTVDTLNKWLPKNTIIPAATDTTPLHTQIAANTAAINAKLNISDAATTYFPLTGGTLTGTGGNGYVGFNPQSSTPSTPTSGFRLFATNPGAFAWITSQGYARELRVRAQTQNNIYYLQDKSYTLADSADVAAKENALTFSAPLKRTGNTISADTTTAITGLVTKAFLANQNYGSGNGTDNTAYHTVTTLADSTGFTLNRPNGTKDTVQISIPSAIDTTGKFVNRITKNATNDSFYIWKGTGYTALKDSVGSASGGSGGLDTSAIHKTGDETVRSGIKTFSSPLSGGASGAMVTPIKINSTLTAGTTSDTLAEIYLSPTFAGAATQKAWSIYSTKDISVSGIRIGVGKASDQSNAVFGLDAFNTATTGTAQFTTAIGNSALKAASNTSTYNTAVGASAGATVSTGSQNTFVGMNSGSAVTNSVSNNSGVGMYSLSQATGSNNVGIGVSAGRNFATGGIAIGLSAGQNETGSNKLYINNAANGGIVVGDMSTNQIMLHAPKTHPTAASTMLSASAFEVYNNVGASFTNRGAISAPVMTAAQRDAVPVQSGQITRIYAITQTGYTSAPTVTIGGSGTGATATATLSSGALYFTITAAGTGYSPATTTVTLSGGGGTGTAYALVGAQGTQVYCVDCTATDGSTGGVIQTFNGTTWKNNW